MAIYAHYIILTPGVMSVHNWYDMSTRVSVHLYLFDYVKHVLTALK